MMDYGPNWPPRPTARRRLDVPMLRPWPLAIRVGMLIVLVGAFGVATLNGGYIRTVNLHLEDGPHTTYGTTTAGPPVAGHGQASHRPHRWGVQPACALSSPSPPS